ncbi:hypothetical protein FRC12_012859 [Ceratobasidium sp. 428]|nr:hypothetical protein FRC12_012859 [Ceratobasidium sp. 428]
MPLTFVQQLELEELQRSRKSSTKTPNSHPTENTPRRSERKRRPSAHQLESQAYEAEASSRAGSRSPSPSGPKSTKRTPKSARKSTSKSASKPTSKPAKSKEPKHPFGTRGDRPGRIVQPVVNVGAASHSSSPEPLAAAESDHGDLEVETQRDGFFHIVHITREKAIRLATKHTGRDASSYSTQTLQKVLEDILPLDEASAVEIEEQAPPTQYESARRLVLGSGQQSPAAGAADDTGSQGASPKLKVAPGSDAEEPAVDVMAVDEPAVDESAVDEPAAGNTDMEFEPDPIGLGPEDSVSQQPYFELPDSATKPKTPPHPCSTTFPRTPHPTKSILVIDADDDDSDTNTIDTDEESALARKRQRLVQPPQSPPPRRLSHSIPRAQPSQLGIYRPSGSKVGALPLRTARHTPARTGGSTVLLKPPPGSDMKTGLAWAMEFAKREAHTRATVVQTAGTSRQSTADFDLLAQVLGELHALANTAPPLPSSTRGSRRLPHATEDLAEREAQVAFALGKRPPALSDFPGLPGLVASHAIPELVARAFARGPYEGYGTNDKWATDIFREVAAELSDEAVADPCRELRSLMVRRISVGRGDAADRLRQLTTFCYGFIVAPESIDDVRHNVDLVKSLLPDWFHYRDPSKRKDPYENPALKQFLARMLFWARDSFGVIYHDNFEPAIPVPSIAFALTMMEHDIKEWGTGYFVKMELDSRTEAEAYRTHLSGLLTYEKGAPGRFHEFQETASKYGLNYAGMSEHLNQPEQVAIRVEDIRPDSPATKARAKARAKGKARAID